MQSIELWCAIAHLRISRFRVRSYGPSRNDEAELHHHRALLMRPALLRRFLAVAGDHAHALIQPRDDVVDVAGLQEGDAVLAAGCEDSIPCALHLQRKRLARHGAVAERETEVARADLGKAQAGHGQNLLAMGDAFRAFQLYA